MLMLLLALHLNRSSHNSLQMFLHLTDIRQRQPPGEWWRNATDRLRPRQPQVNAYREPTPVVESPPESDAESQASSSAHDASIYEPKVELVLLLKCVDVGWRIPSMLLCGRAGGENGGAMEHGER